MAESMTYEPVLSSKVTAFLIGLPKARQRRLIALLYQLAESPGQIGDYSESDDTSRDIQFMIIQDQLIAFWLDHAVKELRIVDSEEV